MNSFLLPAHAALALACACAAPAPEPAVGRPTLVGRAEQAAARPATSAKPEVPRDATASPSAIRWVRDDPDAALARAEREGKLVLVDLWAAWCHTCLSMQRFVLTDAKLPSASARFVFLSIDTDLAKNADFLRRFPTSGWPTLYVLSPHGPSVRGRWLGAASPAQLARFLADAEHSEATAASTAALLEPSALLAAADTLAAEGRYAEAAAKYGEALAHAPRDWPRAPDVRVARASALLRSSNPGACVDMAFDPSFDELGSPISASDLAASVLDCADRLPARDGRRSRARVLVERRLTALCESGSAELTPDDRGDACGNLIAAREALADAKGARRAAETRLALLEAAARDMPDEVALIYDAARTDTLVLLGRGEEALALLTAREQALPDSYNPPHYLARVAKQLGRWDLGLAAADRALALAYGPRRATLYTVKVDLLLGAGRPGDAKVVLAEQIAALLALPEGQRRPEAERLARERLAGLARAKKP